MSNMVFPTCPREDCTVIGHHWHDVDGTIRTHLESTCADPWYPTNQIGCVDTHEPAYQTGHEPTEVMDEAHPYATEQAAEAQDRVIRRPSTKGPTMNDAVSDEQRARALNLYRLYYRTLTGVEPAVTDVGKLLASEVKALLEVEEFILQSHTCEPVWRPVTFAEIQPGWEVRSRSRKGTEASWGVAHHQDRDGDWRTEAGALLTYGASGWTHETTAPEPEPDPRVGLLEGVCLRDGVVLTRSDAALLLSIADAAAPTNHRKGT